MSLADLSVTEASRLLARREVSSVDLLEDVLRRAGETEPSVHAYTVVMEHESRAAARAAEQAYEAGRPPSPIAGIPFGVKDVFDTVDAPTEEGSRALRGRRTGHDATVVSRLRRAGAVMVGKTVTHELQLGVNEIPTRNAWDPRHIPGGSSAGSAVSVAAGSAGFALGTDTGGSVRVPAAFNGVVGLKATYGRISGSGVRGPGGTFSHVGPIARTCEDLGRVLGTIAGADVDDPSTIDEPVPELVPYGSSLEGVRLGVDRSFFYADAVPEVERLVDAALADLVTLGADVVECRIPALELMEPAGLIMALSESTARYLPGLLQCPGSYDPQTTTMIKAGALSPATDYITAQRARPYLRDCMRNAFRRDRLDALFGPTSPVTAPPVGEEARTLVGGSREEDLSGTVRLSLPASVSGQPALTVPCGLSGGGLPVGFQLIGKPFGEREILRIGHAYERTRPIGRAGTGGA